MSIILETVKKRDGTIVDFDENKIIAAVTRAFGSPIPKKVLKRINHLIEVADFDNGHVDIERIQDIVEMALVKEGYFQVAKDYILYRDEKAKLREQKMKLLDVDSLSEVEKRYSYNALRIFKERYLLKDNEGNIVERLDDLFKRVAVASGIMEVLYDERFFDKEGNHKRPYDNNSYYSRLERMQEEIKDIDYKEINKYHSCIQWGDFIINPFHIERLFARYIELCDEHCVLESWGDIYNSLIEDKSIQQKYLKQIQKYYDLMAHKVFLPNTPTLMNAGTRLGQLSACFVIDTEDDINSLADLYKDVMLISKSGGGVGCNYSKLRPQGDIVKSTGGQSSGVISFMSIVDTITDVVKQGGKRKGANMGILNSNHPEILKFIKIKNNVSKLFENFNISINVDEDFMKAFFEDKDYELTFKGQSHGSINAKSMMNMVINNVWETGDPGMVFSKNINSNNFLAKYVGKLLDSTNPCGEQSLNPYESCTLGSINLTKFAENGKFNSEKFMATVSVCAQFLDGVLDANKYPVEKINDTTKATRRIGLGYMGLGDLMTQLGVQYNSGKGFTLSEYITALMSGVALYTSVHIANIKGSFPAYYDKGYEEFRNKLPINAIIKPEYTEELMRRLPEISDIVGNLIQIDEYYKAIPIEEMGLRNAHQTTLAPTGSLSMFADVSNGIEPVFSHGFTKKITIGDFDYVNKFLEEALRKEGIYSEQLVKKIVKDHNGRVNLPEIPQHLKDVFITAMEIHPYDHIMIQALCQRWISNSIAKTINSPNDVSPKDIEHCYVLAWASGCCGTTLYRDGSKHTQVLYNNSIEKKKSNLKTSDFTVNFIRNLDIPNEYRDELLKSCEHGDGGQPTDDSIQTNTITYCPSCGAGNSLQTNGSRCQLCKACGAGIGSCN